MVSFDHPSISISIGSIGSTKTWCASFFLYLVILYRLRDVTLLHLIRLVNDRQDFAVDHFRDEQLME